MFTYRQCAVYSGIQLLAELSNNVVLEQNDDVVHDQSHAHEFVMTHACSFSDKHDPTYLLSSRSALCAALYMTTCRLFCTKPCDTKTQQLLCKKTAKGRIVCHVKLFKYIVIIVLNCFSFGISHMKCLFNAL